MSEIADAYVAGLKRERASMAQYGKADRVAAIDAELRRVGADVPGNVQTALSDAPKPIKRTTNRKG